MRNAQAELDVLSAMLSAKIRERAGKKRLRIVKPEPTESPEIDMSPRWIKIRAIESMAAPHPWGQMAIRQYLDAKRVPYPSDLTDVQLDELESRIERYADMEACGHYLPDCPAF